MGLDNDMGLSLVRADNNSKCASGALTVARCFHPRQRNEMKLIASWQQLNCNALSVSSIFEFFPGYGSYKGIRHLNTA